MSKIETGIPNQNNVEDQSPKSGEVPQFILLTDADINPFLTEAQRRDILAGKSQDPEWD